MYVGRFAPSPTGPLHFGSLVAAIASYCDAKKNNGKWLIRMEDLDKPREMAGAAEAILHTLEALGFVWDDPVTYQSLRAEYYENTLQALQNYQLIYPCSCSRKEIADSSISTGIEGAIYNKNCLFKTVKSDAKTAWRLNTSFAPNLTVLKSQKIQLTRFHDAIQGEIAQNIAADIGDFVLKRADGLFAYQLAVVVDDALQGITHIVRGADLLSSTPRQIYLQQLLDFATPNYAHVPIATNQAGEKLSKQTLAKPIDARIASQQVFNALQFLGQHPPAEMQNATLDDTWRWAIENWQLANVPKQTKIAI